MKVRDEKNYGLSGKRIDLNLMDCMEAGMMAGEIRATLEEITVLEKEHGLSMHDQEVKDILVRANIFFSKIALEPSQRSTIFEQEEEAQEECA